MSNVGRRDFVALAAIATTPAQGAEFFSASEAKWIKALMARIIPADDAPGANEANSIGYLEKQLKGALSRFAGAYRTGIASFEKAHPDFLSLDAEAQDRLLVALERDPFFEMLIDHTMQAFYGSPEHGGNRDEASWKMMSIEKYMGGGHWHGA